MERTAENILNETPQFESQYAINVWVENLTVPDLISQLNKYSLRVDGKKEELTERLAIFIAMKRGYDEVPWDLSDQDFNFTCEFSHRLQTKWVTENSRIPNKCLASFGGDKKLTSGGEKFSHAATKTPTNWLRDWSIA